MPDNTQVASGTGVLVATDAVTYSGDANQNVQLMRPVLVTGAEGSKTVVDLTGDSANGLDVDLTRIGSSVSAGNSSSAALGSNAVFTGTAVDVTDVAIASIALKADQASATDGLSIQQSTDNSNWDHATTFTIPASTARAFFVPLVAQYLRVVYTNGGSAQGSFRLQTVLHKIAVEGTVARPSDGRTNEIGLSEALAYLALFNGTTWDRVRGDTTNGVDVDVTRLPALVAGSAIIGKVTTDQTTHGTTDLVAADITKIAGTAPTTVGKLDVKSAAGDLLVSGDVANDGADSGNPVKIGSRAVAHGSNPTAVSAAGDRVDRIANRAGIPFQIGGHPNPVMYGMSITTGATNAVIGPTINTGTKLVVTGLTVLLDNASTVFPSVVIGFGTTTTPAFATTPGTSKVIAGHPAVPAGGGFNRGDGSGIIGVGADDEELRITTVGTAGGNGLYVLLTGYTIES